MRHRMGCGASVPAEAAAAPREREKAPAASPSSSPQSNKVLFHKKVRLRVVSVRPAAAPRAALL